MDGDGGPTGSAKSGPEAYDRPLGVKPTTHSVQRRTVCIQAGQTPLPEPDADLAGVDREDFTTV